MRYTNTFDLDEYFKCILSDKFAVINSEAIDKEGQEEEFIMLALRCAAGLDLNKYFECFGEDFLKKYSAPLKKVREYVEVSEYCVKIKPEYLFVQNSIITEFLK